LYYTAAEVAEILGLEKNSIIHRCKKGYYSGVIKTEPDKSNTQGMWLIPISEIDTPVMTKEVATLTRQLTQVDLEKAFVSAVCNAIEPLQEKIEAQTAEIKALQTEIETMNKKQEKIEQAADRRDKQLMEAIRAIQEERKKTFWQRILGK
jgi:hypothetical protein